MNWDEANLIALDPGARRTRPALDRLKAQVMCRFIAALKEQAKTSPRSQLAKEVRVAAAAD